MAYHGQDPVILFDHAGLPMRQRAATSDLDPDFLKGFSQLMNNASGSMLKKALESPYQFYVWVYACAGIISTSLCRLPPMLYDAEDTNKTTLKHEVLKLFSRPNPFMTGSQFIEAIILNLMLPTKRTSGGQCFLIPDDDRGAQATNFSKGEIPRQLYPFSDEYVFAVVENGRFMRWELRLPNTPVLKLSQDEVIRIHLYNPYNMLGGMSPFSAAVYGVESDLKSSELARKFSDNAASIGGMLTTDKGLSPEAAEDLRTAWEAKFGGPGKAGRTAILHSGLHFEQTAKSLVDLQFIEGKKLNREEILAAYRVSPFVLGTSADQGLNYATANAAMKGFWELTLLPLLDRMWESINSQWFNNIDGGKWKGYSDTSQIEALRADYSAKVTIADTMIKHGVTTAEAYRTMDIPVDVKLQPWLADPLVIGSRVNLKTGEVIGQPTFGIEPTPAPARKVHDHNLRFLEREGSLIVTEEARERFWMGWVKRTLNPGELRFKQMMSKYFIAQRNAMLDSVDEWARKTKSLRNRAAGDELIALSLSEWNAALKKLALPIYEVGVTTQATQMADELDGIVNWSQNAPYVDKYVQERLDYMEDINTATFDLAEEEIADAIEEAVANNLSVAEASQLIKDSVQGVYGVRLNNTPTIARTEMGSIATTTRFSIMDKEGIEEHEWLSARDERVRDEHVDEDGHHVRLGETFPSTGLTYPGEIGGAPEQVINCRCVAIVYKP